MYFGIIHTNKRILSMAKKKDKVRIVNKDTGLPFTVEDLNGVFELTDAQKYELDCILEWEKRSNRKPFVLGVPS